MGIIKQGILGGFSGKVGSVVGTSWKGRAVMKAMPLSVANPRTAGQVAQRGKFKYITNIASQLLSSIVKPLNDRFAGNVSGYNAFVSRNLNIINSGLANGLVIAKGKMTAPAVTDVLANVNSLQLLWSPDVSDQYSMDSDQLYVSVVSVASAGDSGVLVKGYPAVAVRLDGAITIDITELGLSLGNTLSVSAAFLRNDGTVVSDTFITDVVVE